MRQKMKNLYYIIYLATAVPLVAQMPTDPVLDKNCLSCHKMQKLPDNLIYRRYLLRYSSPKRIEAALVAYLQHPSQRSSIMPAEFFLRFPIKSRTNLDIDTLRENIRRYIDHYDIRKYLQPNNTSTTK